MNRAKLAITIALLALVAATLVRIFIRQADPGLPPAPNPTDGLVVYCFHGDFHCATCDHIEQYTHKALVGKFVAWFERGKLFWKVVNVDQPANAHFVQEYRVVSGAVVLATFRGGREVRWRNLNEVWDLVHNEDEFVQYVQVEIAHELEGLK